VRSRVASSFVACAALLVATGCSDAATAPDDAPAAVAEVSDDTTTTTVGEPAELAEGDDLYAVPDPLPEGEHGDLLRYQSIDEDIDGVAAYRIMYLSESLQGEPIAVTGTALVPEAEALDGGWPVIAHSHGTTGLADQCAPSRNFPGRGGELSLLSSVADRYVVAATDYEGLGTPGLHPYLVGESEGRSTMDAARAAAQLPGVETSPTTFIAGYSQGGHGALWANQVAGTWTPELEVVGAFAGAPPGEFPLIATVASQGGLAGGFFMLIAAGTAAAYPDAHLEDILTPEGVQALAVADQECVGEALEALVGGGYVAVDPNTVEPWGELLEATNPGDIRAEGPVLIVHSEADDVVPAALSAAILTSQCAVGQVVERRTLPSGSHGEAAPVAYAQAFEWFDGILAGAEPVSSCS
jgi:hypothetical protein